MVNSEGRYSKHASRDGPWVVWGVLVEQSPNHSRIHDVCTDTDDVRDAVRSLHDIPARE